MMGKRAKIYFFLFASSSAFYESDTDVRRCYEAKGKCSNLGFPKLALALAASAPALLAESTVSLEPTLLVGDTARSLVNIGFGDGEVGPGRGCRKLLALAAPVSRKCTVTDRRTHSRVALLGLLRVTGEDNEASLVRLETLDVECLALLAQVPPPMVNNNANTAGLLAADTSLLELGQSEPTALANLPVVSYGLGADGGAEESEWAHAQSSGLGLASLAATELASRLVEPSAHPELPVLPEVVVVKDYE